MLAAECGRAVSRATVWRVLRRAGFTLKKVCALPAQFTRNNLGLSYQITKVAAERSAEKRLDYLDRISKYHPSQLVFVDESSVDRRTTYRGHAWSIRGTKAQRKAFFVRGKRYVIASCDLSCSTLSRYSVLPAISLDGGILHCDIIQGSFCTATFSEFIRVLLENMNRYPAANSVIVLDNCRIHKHPDIQEMIKNRYVMIYA